MAGAIGDFSTIEAFRLGAPIRYHLQIGQTNISGQKTWPKGSEWTETRTYWPPGFIVIYVDALQLVDHARSIRLVGQLVQPLKFRYYVRIDFQLVLIRGWPVTFCLPD